MTTPYAWNHVLLSFRMSSFFIRKNDKKRKRRKGEEKMKQKSKRSKKDEKILDEEIASDSNEEDIRSDPFHDLGIDEDPVTDQDETPAEKRLRLAKQYLEDLEEKEREKNDAIDHDAISHRLREEVLEQSGRLQRKVADQYLPPSTEESVRFFKGHHLSVTSLCLSPDDQYAFTGSKDCSIIKWNISSGLSKEVIIPGCRRGLEGGAIGHTGHVLALAISSDGKYLASGGTDRVIHIWNPDTCVHIHTFRGHKDTVSGLVFQSGTHELFSCSFDRTIKIWNVDELTYIETLFGHQDAVTNIDCLSRERPVSAGANDRTVRVWKVVDESQLVFNGHKSSIDTVKMINNDYFVSGSQDGSLALWNILKKKPLATVKHNCQNQAASLLEHWVTTVTTLPYTDLIASGSDDGEIHLWKCGDSFRSLEQRFSISLTGFINCLSFSKNGEFLVAAIGQEHKFGRWWKNKECKNGLAIIKLSKTVI